MSNITETTLKNNRPAFYGNCPVCKTKMFRIGSLADAKKKADDTAAKQVYGKMNEEEKKAFVRRMKKGKKDAAKGKKKYTLRVKYEKGDIQTDKQYIAWLRKTIKTRMKNPKNYSSDYSRGELRGYKEALKKLTK